MTPPRRRSRRVVRRLLAGLASLALVSGMVAVGSPGAQAAPALGTGGADPAGKVQAELQQSLQANGSADFWIRFTDRADLSQIGRAHV